MDTNIIVLGDTNVGKTSIINQYLQYSRNNSDNKDINLIDYSGKCTEQISISDYIYNCKIIVIVFDLNNDNTFTSADIWYKLITNFIMPQTVSFYLVGNKNDLEHHISYNDIETYAKYRNMFYYSINMNDINSLFKSINNTLINNPNNKSRLCNWFF